MSKISYTNVEKSSNNINSISSRFLESLQRKKKNKLQFEINLLVLFSVVLLVFACNKRLIRKDDMTLINEHYAQNTYYVKDNIVLDNKDIIKKDTSVKIWIESTASILKVKVYNSNEERESAIGKMVAYIINEDFKGKHFTVEYLDQLIAEKLVYYDPKELSKNKKTKK